MYSYTCIHFNSAPLAVGGRGAQDSSGHLEDTVFTAEDTTASAAALHAQAALMDCDAALEMQPGHVKAKFRRAAALHRLGRVAEARSAATSALHGAPTEETEEEVKALLRSFDEEWTPTPAVEERENAEKVDDDEEEEDGVAGLSKGVKSVGRGLLASMAGGGGGGGEDGDDEGGSVGGLLASMAAGSADAAKEDARASFVSAAAAALDDAALGLTGSKPAAAAAAAADAAAGGPAPVSSVYGFPDRAVAAGVEALGADGDELYDLD